MTYFGQITNLFATDKAGVARHNLGRGCVLTRWGKVSIKDVQPNPEGLYLLSDHEGLHVSARSQYNWKKGKYTFTLKRKETDPDSSGKTIWLQGVLYSHELKESHIVGSIRFSGTTLQFDGILTSFLEIYGSDENARPVVPEFRIALGDIRVNGEPVHQKAALAIYPANVPAQARAYRYVGNEKSFPEVRDQFKNMEDVVVLDVASERILGRPKRDVLVPLNEK